MRRALPVLVVAVLFTGANALLYTGDWSDEDDVLLISLLVGISVAFGLLVGQVWALALPLTWAPLSLVLILLDQDPGREVSTLYVVVLTLVITAPLQAGGVALGVLLRRRLNGPHDPFHPPRVLPSRHATVLHRAPGGHSGCRRVGWA